MAPECESGAHGPITVAADLYSAGKILWSAVTGERAFSQENPAFNSKSMAEVFPNTPSTWHLHHVFEKTIRRECRNRWASAADAVSAARRIKQIIRCGYPPLEETLEGRCPICGFGELQNFIEGHAVFGNPNPAGIGSRQCSYCGFCFAVNYSNAKGIISGRKQLD